MLTNHFTTEELQPIKDGIRRYIRLMGLIYDPNPLVWNKWLTDESDLKAALRSVADAFKASATMLGKRKYIGMDFDAPREVKKDLTTFLTTGKDCGETATLQKRNLPMFYLVVEPVINLFYKFDHATMIAIADELTDDVCKMVDACTEYGTYDDALIAQHQVREMIRAREEVRKAELEKKRKRKKSRDPVAELFASLGLDVEDTLAEDELMYE